MNPQVIRAGKTNLFLSDLFADSFVNATNVPVELHQSDGSIGASLGAGIGAGVYASPKEAFHHMKPLKLIEPVAARQQEYDSIYHEWKELLEKQL